MTSFDSVVIGAGPAGMAALHYLNRFGLRTAFVEKNDFGGLLLKTTEIDNYPGIVGKISGYDLAQTLSGEITSPLLQHIKGEVLAIETPFAPLKTIQTTDGTIKTKSLIVASGLEYRKLNIQGEDFLLGKGISYCALCDGLFFKDQTIAVVGGGDSALKEALYLSGIASKVYLIHRKNRFTASRSYQESIAKVTNIEILFDTRIESLIGTRALEGIKVRNTVSQQLSTLVVTGLFIFIGASVTDTFFPVALQRDSLGFIKTDAEMKTSIPGIFAAGDIRSKSCRQIITAIGDGVTAANSTYNYLGTRI